MWLRPVRRTGPGRPLFLLFDDTKSNAIGFANKAFATLHGMSSDKAHGI